MVFENYCQNEICFVLLLLTLHLIMNKLFYYNELSTWYFIHFIGNFYIVIFCLYPIFIIFKDPIQHLFNPTPYYDTMVLVDILHLYHLLLFKCTKDDIFHHLFFVGFGTLTVYIFNNGYYTALTHFFICGLPGGIDYFYLFLYQNKYITKEERLKYAMFLNVWIRSPGLCMLATFALINFIYSQKTFFNIVEFTLQLILTIGNGQMYMRDVVYAAGKKNVY
jgi:hypothetical protein